MLQFTISGFLKAVCARRGLSGAAGLRPSCLTCLVLLACLCAAVAASAREGEAPPVAPATRLNPAELEIWRNPAFQKQFAESYIAETEIEPRVTVDERKQMQEVLDLISSDKVDEAEQLLSKELARNEAASAVFDFSLANIYFQQEKFDQASAAYQRALDKYPKFRRAWKNIGLIRVRQGEFDKALPALTRVVELGGNDAVTYGLLGFAYSSVGNYLAAESAYRMAILLDPVTLDWKMGLARSFFKQERYGEAVALCGQLIEGQPDRADLWLLQANAYIGMNEPLQAAGIYELVEQLGKSTGESLAMLGDIYVNEELYKLAVDSYIRAMDRDAKSSPERFVRAAKVLVAHGAMEQTRRLIEQIEKAYSKNLKDADRKDLLKLRARLAVAQGTGDEEVEVLKQIVELDPLDGEALILLGQHSQRSGDAEKAIFYFERAASVEACEADAKVRHAQLLVEQRKYAEALPLLRRAQQIKPRESVQQYLEQVERVAKTR